MLNKKYILTIVSLFILVLSSCTKENLDETSTDENENPVAVVECDDFEIEIIETEDTLTVEISEGTAPFTYSWSTEENTESIIIEEPGVYEVTITDSTGCVVSNEVTVAEQSEACNDFALELYELDNTLISEISGGTAPFTYSWSTDENTESISVDESGIYNLTVTDSLGCTVSGQIIYEVETVGCDGFGADLFFNDGLIAAEIMGGTAPYTYEWSTGETSETISVTESGVFTVTITDAQGCIILQEIFAEFNTNDCNDLNLELFDLDGAIGAEVWGGTPPYIFEWSNGENSETISVTESGVYSVVITDSQGCTISQEIFVEFNSNDCSDLTVEVVDYDGYLVAEVYGGTPPYNFNWSTGESIEAINPTESGFYYVVITDANGCIVENGIFVDLESSQCEGFELSINHNGSGLLTAEVSGGTPPYNYEWSTGDFTSEIIVNGDGYYTLFVIDALGCTLEESINVAVNPTDCSNTLELNAGGTNTPIMFSAESEAYLWKSSCSEFSNQFTPEYDHNYLIVDVDWDGFGTNQDPNYFSISDGLPGITFGSNGKPQAGDVLNPYFIAEDYFYAEAQGILYNIDEIEVLILASSNIEGGRIEGLVLGSISDQNDSNNTSSIAGKFCVSIVSVCE